MKCNQLTKYGSPCFAHAMRGSERCASHSIARIALLESAVKAAEEMRGAARDFTPLDHPLDNFPNQAGKYLAKKIAAFDAANERLKEGT